MRSAHSMTLAWTPHAERRRPKMVLERISPSLWSGFLARNESRGLPYHRLRFPCPAQKGLPIQSLTLKAQRLTNAPTLPPAPASSSAVVCQPLCPPSIWCELRGTAILQRSRWDGATRCSRRSGVLRRWRVNARPGGAGRTRESGGAGPPSPVDPPAPPDSLLPPAPPWSSGSPDLRLSPPEPSAPPWPPPDPQHPPGSLALRLRLGLLHHLLRHRWSAPWSRRPFLLHGFSLRQLYLGPSSWLWPGSCCAPPAPGPSCLLPGSSFLRRLSCLCPSSSSWASSLIPTCSPLCCSTARGRTFREGGDMSGLWTCFAPVSVQCSIIWSCSSPRLV